MSLTLAHQKALQEMEFILPNVVAARSGAHFDGQAFTLKLFYRTFRISYPDIAVSEVRAKEPPPLWLQIVLLHYLRTADGTPVADRWIAFRELNGGRFFESGYMRQSIAPLVARFGRDLAGFSQASGLLGGTVINRTGDAGYRFMAFPRFPMGCILYLADDEMPASINVLLDESAGQYLPTEDISILVSYFSNLLMSFAE